MSSKKIYIGAVLIILFTVLLISRHNKSEVNRIEQHTAYNVDVKDNNLSVEPDTFSTRLPIVNINTHDQEIPGKPAEGQTVNILENSYIQADIEIIANENALNTLQSAPVLDSSVRIRVRGNSSRGLDKSGYLLKFCDKQGNEESHQVMGMEKNSTWVLHGPYLDKTLMRNYMWYNFSGRIMEWAPDARFCEVFLNGLYQGVYVMIEQINVAAGRINVTKYDGRSGKTSYLICADRESVNDAELTNLTEYTRRMYTKFEVKYPGTKTLTPELTEYISKDFSEFEKALYSFDYDTVRYGYQNYIDVDSFVDYFIINEVTQNTDAGTFSTFFYKDIAGKLKMCVWDFNNCCDNYVEKQVPMAEFFMPNHTWFFMLCKDEAFINKVISRYRELRKGILSDEYVENYIQEVQSYLGAAVERNFAVWGYSFNLENDLLLGEERKIGSHKAAMGQYEDQLLDHMQWMDEHIEDLKFYCHESKNKKYNH